MLEHTTRRAITIFYETIGTIIWKRLKVSFQYVNFLWWVNSRYITEEEKTNLGFFFF